jgi:hypothetical protein
VLFVLAKNDEAPPKPERVKGMDKLSTREVDGTHWMM